MNTSREYEDDKLAIIRMMVYVEHELSRLGLEDDARDLSTIIARLSLGSAGTAARLDGSTRGG